MHTFLILVISFGTQIVEVPMKMFDTNAECRAAGLFIAENVELSIKGATDIGLACVKGA